MTHLSLCSGISKWLMGYNNQSGKKAFTRSRTILPALRGRTVQKTHWPAPGRPFSVQKASVLQSIMHGLVYAAARGNVDQVSAFGASTKILGVTLRKLRHIKPVNSSSQRSKLAEQCPGKPANTLLKLPHHPSSQTRRYSVAQGQGQQLNPINQNPTQVYPILAAIAAHERGEP